MTDLYRVAFRWVLAAWVVGVVVTVGWVEVQDSSRVGDTLFVAAMSGAIALVSMLPGLCIRWGKAVRRRLTSGANSPVAETSLDQFSEFAFASGMGMIFRLFGTVALFLFCRYQLAETKQWVAGFTIGWYAFLTLVEVGVLAGKRDRTFTRPEASASDTDVSLLAKKLPAKAGDAPSPLVDSSVSLFSSLLLLNNLTALHPRSLGVLEA
ncbi:hypothetical protein Pla52o_05110 [Novipirellula galeiformis]|uniref:Uncharacterized protein n=1 Tax=Novipirellula galeiformis TaxID=2528004 RepID=A0A5C6CQQ3_9BACT|nr:hypothetical protein Pla52o_05110 [Novipirellula galeiformis]